MSRVPALRALSPGSLEALCSALRTGQLGPPYSTLSLIQFAPDDSRAVAEDLEALAQVGMTPGHVAILAEALLAERQRRSGDDIDVVTTGPDPSLSSRDTAVVTRELFAGAQRRVLAVGYAVHQGDVVFRTLAERLDQSSGLEVRLCIDIQRRPGDTSIADDIVARFAERFARAEWPGKRLPRVFFDPRSLDATTRHRASLHAKCIVVDGSAALVTSANFTEAAQERNIELGLHVRNAVVCQRIEEHFSKLIGNGHLQAIHFAQR